MIFTYEFSNKRFALLEWGSVYRWGEHYVLIQGTKGAIRLTCSTVKELKLIYKKAISIHESQCKEDDDRSHLP